MTVHGLVSLYRLCDVILLPDLQIVCQGTPGLFALPPVNLSR